jgi:hypothetical protein
LGGVCFRTKYNLEEDFQLVVPEHFLVRIYL